MNEFQFRKRSMDISVEGTPYTFHPLTPETLRTLNDRLQKAQKAKASAEEQFGIYEDIIDACLGQGATDKIFADRSDLSFEEMYKDADDLLLYLMACQEMCRATRRPGLSGLARKADGPKGK